MKQPLRLAIIGASGRMGRALIRLAKERAEFMLIAAVTEAHDPSIGQDAGISAGIGTIGVPLRCDCAAPCDVAIEFTSPAAIPIWSDWAAKHGVAYVSGTTGLGDREQQALRAAAERVPVLWASNMSVGVAILTELVRRCAAWLPDWDLEIIEAHHRNKADAPSGTAKTLLQAACAARDTNANNVATHGRSGQVGARRAGEIGVHAVRLGGIVGEHDVRLASMEETLTLSHRAETRDVFATGALRAARWLHGRKPGLYGVGDMMKME